MKTQASDIDMLHGSLRGKIIRFALPIALSSVLTQLFNTIDVAVVGRYASSLALAAVGANTFIINLLIVLFFGISIGSSVVIAKYIGQADEERIERSIHTTAALSLVSGVLLLIVGLLLAEPLLSWMGTPADVLPDASLYLRIFLLGSPFFMIYTFGAAILRSRGDSKRPLYILVAAGIANTLLNLLLVIALRMGVAGVAIGTSVSNLLSAVAVTRLLCREPGIYRLHLGRIRFHAHETMEMLKIGLPAGFQGMTFSLSNIFVQSSINTFGAAAIAGSSVAQTFEAYCYFLMAAFNSAATTFVGQNYGAGLIARCKRICWICLAYGALTCAVANGLFYLFAEEAMGLFTSDAEVVRYGCIRIAHVLIFQSIAAAYDIPSAVMRGLGHSLEPTLTTIFGTCVLRLVWVFVLFPIYGAYDQLLMVYPLSWLLTSILMFVLYIFTIRRMEGLRVFPVRSLTQRITTHLPRPVKRLWQGRW